MGFGNRTTHERPPGSDLQASMPWSNAGPEAEMRAVAAKSQIYAYLKAMLSGRRGMQLETLITALGALSGFAAQHAVWEKYVRAGRFPVEDKTDRGAGAFIITRSPKGERIYAGYLLDTFLLPVSGGPARPILSKAHTPYRILADLVQELGQAPLSMQEITELSGRTMAAVGSSDFGRPRVPSRHYPRMLPRDVLNATWFGFRSLMEDRTVAMAPGLSVPAEHWSALVAALTRDLLRDTQSLLSPEIGMRIFWEAAVPMSRIDPQTIAPPAAAEKRRNAG